MNNETIDIAWTVLAALGLAITLWAMWDAWGDWQLTKAAGLRGPRRIGAFQGFRSEVLRVVMQFIFLLMGLAAIYDSPLASITPLGFVLVEASIVTGAILDRHTRARLIAIYERRP